MLAFYMVGSSTPASLWVWVVCAVVLACVPWSKAQITRAAAVAVLFAGIVMPMIYLCCCELWWCWWP